MPPRKADIVRSIEARVGIPDLARMLADRLSGSELNSLLLAVFDHRLRNETPARVLQQYSANRFVSPADVDMIELAEFERDTLVFLRERNFQPLELSPLAQLGSCSVVGTVSQDKIVTALRNSEVMADATNSMALYAAAIKRKNPAAPELMRFCTVQRHVRAQKLKVKGHTAHFKIGCMITSGKDTGDFQFECRQLNSQLSALCGLFRQWGIPALRIKLQPREGYANPEHLIKTVAAHLRDIAGLPEIVIDESTASNNYYKGIQFKIIVTINEKEVEIADGGMTDWTQQFLGNLKERLLICGFGLEWIYKLRSGRI